MTQRPRPTPAPPRHLILTRGAAGCESRPEPDGLQSRALQPPSEPPSRHLGGQGTGYHRKRRSAPGSRAPLCEVGWPHTYFAHKDEGLARRPPAGTQRRLPDPGPGDPDVGQQRGVGSRSLGRKRAAGSRMARAAWAGRGCRARAAAPIEGRWGGGAPGEAGNPGCCSAHCCLLGPADPDPRDPGCSGCAARGQMPASPAPAAGWGQRPDASPCRADKGGVVLLRKVVVTTVSFLQVTFLCRTLLCLFESCNPRRLADVYALRVPIFCLGSVIASSDSSG